MFSKSSYGAIVRGYKVAVCGAAGGIGQPLSLLLKLDTKVTELSLFDVVRTPGVAADISHCCTPAKVTGFTGMEEIGMSLASFFAITSIQFAVYRCRSTGLPSRGDPRRCSS